MKKTALTLAASAIAGGAFAIGINVDTFAEPGTPTVVSDAVADATGDLAIDSGLDPMNTIGGTRVIALETTDNNHPRQDPATFDAGADAAVFDAPTGVVATGRLWYGYADDGQGNPVHDDLNLNIENHDSIDLAFFYNDLDTLDLTIELGTESGGSYNTSLNTVSISPGGLNFTEIVMLGGFVGNADLADVDYIQFTFDAEYGKTFALRNIEVVPEPTTVAALGLGALALFRRKRKS